MKILYIFPHPDDESFGPAPAISSQQRAGNDVYLLTLTRGEATKERTRLGINKQEMGKVRTKEMKAVSEVLQLQELTIKDLPDGQLVDMAPQTIENVIREEIQRIQPDIVVTYEVHGVSGFADHLVCHAVVKRVYEELKQAGAPYLKRLAFFALCSDYNQIEEGLKFNLQYYDLKDIDCVLETDEVDRQAFLDALDCYETYQQTIQDSNVKKTVSNKICFQFYQEHFQPPANCLTQGLRKS